VGEVDPHVSSKTKFPNNSYDLVIISVTSTSEVDLNISSIFPVNIRIHWDIAGIILGIRNNLNPDKCCFHTKEIAEHIGQQVDRGKMWSS